VLTTILTIFSESTDHWLHCWNCNSKKFVPRERGGGISHCTTPSLKYGTDRL